MKLSLAPVFILPAISLAQDIVIGAPKPCASVHAGRQLSVRIEKPNSLTGSEEVALVIGLATCADLPCAKPKAILGEILYKGPFDPKYHRPELPPYQDFVVTIPSDFPKGAAQLNAVNFQLEAAGPQPILQLTNSSLTIV
ncbi:hypothetical protein APHAL10511_002282 [Amanita phalloides]|nr:hypothetical protein APHAL10511_002282 [Amanita phalloides]